MERNQEIRILQEVAGEVGGKLGFYDPVANVFYQLECSE